MIRVESRKLKMKNVEVMKKAPVHKRWSLRKIVSAKSAAKLQRSDCDMDETLQLLLVKRILLQQHDNEDIIDLIKITYFYLVTCAMFKKIDRSREHR